MAYTSSGGKNISDLTLKRLMRSKIPPPLPRFSSCIIYFRGRETKIKSDVVCFSEGNRNRRRTRNREVSGEGGGGIYKRQGEA